MLKNCEENKTLEPKKLPDHCYSTNQLNGRVIAIKFGESGYYPIETKATADELNAVLGVTKAQVEAMVVGSMFGWDCPGANPDMYDDEGRLKR